MLIMKRELKKVFQDHKMIAVVQNNASNAEDMMILKHRLHKHGITVKFFPNQVMRKYYPKYCRQSTVFPQNTLLHLLFLYLMADSREMSGSCGGDRVEERHVMKVANQQLGHPYILIAVL